MADVLFIKNPEKAVRPAAAVKAAPVPDRSHPHKLPYLDSAQHAGQTHPDDEHPCSLHLGLQMFLSFFMPALTFLLVLLYRPAFHNTDADNSYSS